MKLTKFMGLEAGDEYSFFAKKHGLPRPPASLEDVKKYFEKLRDGIKDGELLSVELGAQLSYGACRRDIWREHEAAKFVEKFVEKFLGGVLTSPKTRPPVPSLPPIPEEVAKYLPNKTDFIQNVNRALLEKTDLYFEETGLRISLKSLVPDNNELNVGSFPPRLLFAGFLEEIPDERTKLGSASRLRERFAEIIEKGMWKAFIKRFEYMVDAIYDNIHFVVLERHPMPSPKLVVYIIPSDEFRNLLKSSIAKGPEELTTVLYRFELHSMRLVKREVLSKGDKIEITLPTPDASPIIKYIKSIEKRYRKRLLAGKLTIDAFKKEVIEETNKFLKEVEDMFEKEI